MAGQFGRAVVESIVASTREPLRIAFVHSFYSTAQPSGENRVVEDQVVALREAGHEVRLIGRHTDAEEQRPAYRLTTAFNVSTGAGFDPTAELHEFRPDVVHVQNLFPNIGSRWMADWPGPIVVSVHNYRSVCANGLLFRDGALCTECPEHSSLRAVRHRCYRDSALATVPLAVSRRADQRRILERADIVVTTSEASDAALRRFLPHPIRSVVIPNFGADAAGPPRPTHVDGWVALGRFSEEKGFRELVQAWPVGPALTVIGDGPQRDEVTALAQGRGITVRGALPIDELRAVLPRYQGLVFPSRWLEVAPQVVVEAMRAGLPVIAFDANCVAPLVEETRTGAAYGRSRSLASALALVEADRETMSRAAFELYVSQWTKRAWLTSIESLYRSLRDAAGDRP